MVGVPGKYKGCETCRVRRIKCDNQRPTCQKCISSGRECAGYERERVFITTTIDPESKHPITRGGHMDNRGRNKSPPGNPTAGRSRRPSPPKGVSKIKLRPAGPPQPAWSDFVRVANQDSFHDLRIVVLHTNLEHVQRKSRSDGGEKVILPPYAPPSIQTVGSSKELDVGALCMAHLDPAGESGVNQKSTLLMLCEHNSCMDNPDIPQLDQCHTSRVRQVGPGSFTQFPAHHYFVRVYRQTAVMLALLNRQPTFLSSDEWRTIPWQNHPKSPLDHLLDILVWVPECLSHTDVIASQQPTLARRLQAQELLSSCLSIEEQLDQWHAQAANSNAYTNVPYDPNNLATPTTSSHVTNALFASPFSPLSASASASTSYWAEESEPEPEPANPFNLFANNIISVPFSDHFVFRDAAAALAMLTYWTGMMRLHSAIDVAYTAVCEPVLDDYAQLYPDLPPALQIDVNRYRRGRELAARICGGLDSALGAGVQVDALAGPLAVAAGVYWEVNEVSRDGELELQWCDRFRAVLERVGREVAGEVSGKTWNMVQRF